MKDSNWYFIVNSVICIIKGFRTIVLIIIVISTTFRLICLPSFFRCWSNSGTYTKLRTTSFIESKGVASSVSVSYNAVQELSISVLLLACRQDLTCNHLIISCIWIILKKMTSSACENPECFIQLQRLGSSGEFGVAQSFLLFTSSLWFGVNYLLVSHVWVKYNRLKINCIRNTSYCCIVGM